MARLTGKRKGRPFNIKFQTASLTQLFVTVMLSAGFFLSGVLLLWFATLDIPTVEGFHNRQVAESTKIYDRTGDVLLYDVHGSVRRTLVPLNEVSRHAKNAVVAIEDAEFYEHRGIKPTAFVRAMLANIREGGFSQGGSTITQQVVKLTLLTPEKTVTRKVKEGILAVKLEREMTKDQILEIYLNEAPYGGTIYGIEEASRVFFGKHSSDLTLAEGAYLAALPQAPTYYSPYGNHRERLADRKNLVLSKMLENGFISSEEYDDARAEEVGFADIGNGGIKAPHFVFYVLEYLENKYGREAVFEGGLTVITSLDHELQEEAERIVRERAIRNEVRFNAENASLVAIDPKTGQILTMVGSRGYFDENIDGKFNTALGKRQPGSAFKPFVYATAFAQGYTPETVLFNLRTQFSTACDAFDSENGADPCYSPRNYDNEYTGPTTIRNALAQSVNVPAVKTLYLVGIDNAIKTAKIMGISTLTDATRYGLTLVLGGGEVTLLDMVSSYGVFAEDGVRNPHTPILRVESRSGEVLEEYRGSPRQVITSEVARQINSILSDNVARTPLYGANSPLYFGEGVDVAAKTGTTNDNKDAWIIGYTPSIAVGAWAGNNTPEPMNEISGLIITPLWRDFMDVAFAQGKIQPEIFTEPEPTPENISPALRGIWNVPGRGVHSILHWVDKSNPRGAAPSNPLSDPQYVRWERPVQEWVAGTQTATTTPLPFPPLGLGAIPIQETRAASAEFSILSPPNGQTLAPGSLLTITINASAEAEIKSVSYFVDETLIGSSTQFPFSISYFLPGNGGHVIKAVASGSGGIFSDEVIVTVE